MPNELSARELADWIDAGESFVLVDTRDGESFEAWHVAGARNVPFAAGESLDVDRFEREVAVEPDERVVAICGKGRSSSYLATALEEAGYGSVYHVTDGMRGWGRVYDVVEVSLADARAEIVQVQRRAKGCVGYVVADAAAGEAAVVDPTRHVEQFVDAAEARGWELSAVFDTHVHADHVSGGRTLASSLGVPYYLSDRAANRGLEVDFTPLGRNEVLSVGGVDVKALSTPGHTSEAVCYLIDDDALLTGDTAFVGGVGRTELEFGDSNAREGAEMLYESLHRTVLAEPEAVVVLPGHFTVTNDGETPGVTPGEAVASSVRDLRTGLDLFRLSKPAFVERVADVVGEKPPNYESLVAINAGRETLGDGDRAVELELGPNRCAAGDA